jgi:hypothetical protein
MPGVGKLLGLKEYNRINKVRNNINNITLLLTTAFAVTVIIFNQSFLSTWVGRQHFAGHWANVLIMIMTIQDTFVKNDACIISATLDIKKKVFLTLVSGALFAGLGIILTSKWGIAGLCASLIISRLFLFIGQRKILATIMKTEWHAAFIVNIRSFATAFLLLATAVWLSEKITIIPLYKLILYAPAAFGISLGVFYFFGLNKTNRNELRNLFTSIKFFKSESGFSKN